MTISIYFSGGLRRQTQQRFDGRACPASGPQFQHLSQQYHDNNNAGRLEIDPDGAFRCPHCCREKLGKQNANQAVDVGYRNPESDQSKHVQTFIYDGLNASNKKRPSRPEDHRRCEDQFQPLIGSGSGQCVEKAAARDHTTHGDNQQRERQDGIHNEALAHILIFRITFFFRKRNGFRFQGHAALRAIPRRIPDNL